MALVLSGVIKGLSAFTGRRVYRQKGDPRGFEQCEQSVIDCKHGANKDWEGHDRVDWRLEAKTPVENTIGLFAPYSFAMQRESDLGRILWSLILVAVVGVVIASFAQLC